MNVYAIKDGLIHMRLVQTLLKTDKVSIHTVLCKNLALMKMNAKLVITNVPLNTAVTIVIHIMPVVYTQTWKTDRLCVSCRLSVESID